MTKNTREWLEKRRLAKAEKKAKREAAVQRKKDKLKAEAEAKAEAERIAKLPKPEPPPPPPPPESSNGFTVPSWLSNPRSRYYAQELVDDADYQIKFLNTDGSIHWKSHPGAQTHALLCPFEEIMCGGRRGGGKSAYLIAKAAMGDMTLDYDDPAKSSFLNDRSFRALFLREQYQGLSEFIEQAIEFFKPFGGKPKGDPKFIDFPSGARIYFNHLQDEEAFNKYKGWNLTFIGIEELTMVRSLQQYLKLLGSLRSAPRTRVVMGVDGRPVKKTFPGLRTQIVSTSNPDGPGRVWVKNRFVDVLDKRGNKIPWGTPMIDPITRSTRIFIPFPIEANPTYSITTSEGRRYWSMLMSQDEVTRKQWIEGDWDAGSSLFFTEYRPDGPVGEEEKKHYPWARHRTAPVILQPWWHRWGSGDHGYDHPSAFHKACRNESDRRIHVYDELTMRQVGAFEQGARLAQWWMPELQALQRAGQDPCVVINLGADIFSKKDIEKTLAQQMEAGIKEVLGPYGAILLKYDENERDAMSKDPKRAQQMFQRRVAELQGQMCLALKPTWMERVAAWDYMRELLRFRPAVINLQTDEDREKYLRQVLETEGRERYEYEAEKLRSIKPETLPKVLFWERCEGIDRCLKAAQKDTRNDDDPTKPSKSGDVLKFNANAEGKEGDDELECLIAGTQIQTARGLVPIERVTDEDLVHTRAGLRRVLVSRLVQRDSPVTTVRFSDGATITGTPGHLVWVENKGFIPLECLRNGDIISSWSKRLSSMASSSDGIQNPSGCTSEIISGRGETTESVASDRFIRKSGARIMGLYRKAITSITKMRIPSITKSTILNACRPLTTSRSTGKRNRAGSECEEFRSSVESLQKHLTEARSSGNALALAAEKSWPKGHWSNADVNSAEALFSQNFRLSQDSATSTARPNGAVITSATTKSENAPGAQKSFRRTSGNPCAAVPVSVAASIDAGKADVYDLTVEDVPEYFANGILVHNSVRNLLYAYKTIETTMPLSYFVAEKMQQAQDNYQQAYGDKLTDPTRLAMIAQTQIAKYNTQNSPARKSFTFARASSQRHRVQ